MDQANSISVRPSVVLQLGVSASRSCFQLELDRLQAGSKHTDLTLARLRSAVLRLTEAEYVVEWHSSQHSAALLLLLESWIRCVMLYGQDLTTKQENVSSTAQHMRHFHVHTQTKPRSQRCL